MGLVNLLDVAIHFVSWPTETPRGDLVGVKVYTFTAECIDL